MPSKINVFDPNVPIPKWKHIDIDLEQAEVFFSKYDENDPLTVKLVNQFIDRLYSVANGCDSDSSEELFRIIGKYVRSNYLVDELIKIANDKDSSYLSWYALDTINAIDTQYALDKALDNKYFDERINQLFVRHMNQDRVFNYVLDKIKRGKGLSSDRDVVLKGLQTCIHDKNRREKIRDAYKYVLETSTNYNGAYPSDNIPGHLLRMYVNSEYLNEPEVAEMLNIAKHHANTKFRLLSCKIVDGYYGFDIDVGMKTKALEFALNANDHDIVFKICEKPLTEHIGDMSSQTRKVPNQENTPMYTAILHTINDTVTLSMIEKLLSELKQKFSLRRPTYQYRGGITPLGVPDGSWQSYYEVLITLIIIGHCTTNEKIFDRILQGVAQLDLSEEVYEYVKKIMKTNVKFGHKLETIHKTLCNLIMQHSMHQESDNVTKRYYSYIITGLHRIYDETDNSKIKKSCAYKLSKFVFTDYNWMIRYYDNHTDRSKKIIITELGGALSELNITIP